MTNSIDDVKAECKKFNTPIENRMFVCPIPFSTEGKKMLQHCKWLLDEKDTDGSSLIAIHREQFQNLITALRTAVATEYKLDKTKTSSNDLMDAFMMSNILSQKEVK